MDVVALTKELVALESPSHLTNRHVADLLVDRLKSLGFEVEVTEYRDQAGVTKVNLAGRLGPSDGDQPGLAYFCHSDVVPAEHWTGPGGAYDPIERDGRLFGRGSCDMKGSAACMLTAISQVPRDRLQAPVFFVCTADEERCYLGARDLVQQSPCYRHMVDLQPPVVIGEPTQLQVVHAHKGICKLEFTSHGQAAHSSTRDGCNANLAMIPFLSQLKAIYDETENEAVWQNDEFDPPSLTMNIGINDHTAAVNVKPAQSICTVFYRPLPHVDDSPLLARIRQAATEMGLEIAPPARCDAMYTAPDDAFVVKARALAKQAEAATVAYGTDGGVLTELRQKIVCGPGSIAQAHTSDEWVSLQQLQSGVELYRTFLQNWCVA